MVSVIRKDVIDFRLYSKATEPARKVKSAGDFMEEMLEDAFGEAKDTGGYLPWNKTHEYVRFRPGEVTLWAGINGHGKSLVTGQVALSLMGQRYRTAIASFEMKPKKTLGRMARQWCGMRARAKGDTEEMITLAKDAYRQFCEWGDDKLWLYDQQGTVDQETMRGVVRYCANELKIQHVFIDSLMKCVKGEDDYNGQKEFVDEVCALARDLDIHIHLVHHVKKLSNEDQQPGKFDAKGSGAISDQVDNFMVVFRNKRKERAIAAGENVKPDEADAYIVCDKQRNGEWEGRISLWFDPDSQQFMGMAGSRPVNFDNFPHTSWS